jgi:hypothetical protein
MSKLGSTCDAAAFMVQFQLLSCNISASFLIKTGVLHGYFIFSKITFSSSSYKILELKAAAVLVV